MVAVDLVQSRLELRVQERYEAEVERFKRSHADMEASTSQAVLDSNSSSSSSSAAEDTEDHNPPRASGGGTTPKRARLNIMSPRLSCALDRTMISSRNATFILSEVASSLGHDVTDLNINRSTVRRARANHRATASRNLRSEFTEDVILTAYWDGKLMEDLTSKEHIDRLPVVVSGIGVEQLLGVPKLPSGTGEAQGTAVIGSLEEWGILDLEWWHCALTLQPPILVLIQVLTLSLSRNLEEICSFWLVAII